MDDDASYKLLFSALELVRDLILGFIPDEWLRSLDYSTLERIPASYVTDDLRHRADDVIWRVRAGGEWIYLYILIEFQSTIDRFMAVRIMNYVSLLYQDLIRAKDTLPGHRLPPVLPIVLYNGSRRWNAATDIADLIPRAPGLVAQYLPRLEYLLLDESRYASEDLSGLENLMAAVIRLEQQPENPEAVMRLVDDLNTWLDNQPEIKRTFAIWIRAVLLRRSRNTLALPKVNDLKELKMTLAERFDQWREQYRLEGLEQGLEKGLEEGMERGEAKLLLRLLSRRFGTLPEAIVARIEQAHAEQLEHWGDRVLEATSLDDVFRD